jgi:hypothetical protein
MRTAGFEPARPKAKDFHTTSAFAAVLADVRGLDCPFTVARCRTVGASRPVSTPSPAEDGGLARDYRRHGPDDFPDFGRFCTRRFRRGTQLHRQVLCVCRSTTCAQHHQSATTTIGTLDGPRNPYPSAHRSNAPPLELADPGPDRLPRDVVRQHQGLFQIAGSVRPQGRTPHHSVRGSLPPWFLDPRFGLVIDAAEIRRLFQCPIQR